MKNINFSLKKYSRTEIPFFRYSFFLIITFFILCLPATAISGEEPSIEQALALWNVGKYEQALQQLNSIIDANPDNAKAYEQRGNIYAFLNNFKKAINDYNKAIKLRPNHALAYYYRGTMYTLTNNYEPAIKDYTRAAELRIGYYEAYFHRGSIYSLLGDQPKAIADFSRVIELKPTYSEAYLYRGIAEEESGKYEEALTDFNKALEINPRLENGYIHRGNIYGILGNKEKAGSDYKKANELIPYKSTMKVKSTISKNDAATGAGKTKIFANSDSKIYHLPGMKYYDKVKQYHRVIFSSEQEAIAAGYHKAPE